MTAFAQAFSVSKANMANVDLGHFVAAGPPSNWNTQYPRAQMR
jgi:hypothetical protein